MADSVVFLAERLGGAWTKVGQLLANRHDLLGRDAVEKLAPIQDRFGEIPFARLVAGLSPATLEPFVEICDSPIGSGCLAQVHLAILRSSGRRVAVKIRKPGIQRRIEIDLRILRGIAAFVRMTSPSLSIPIVEIVDGISEKIREQLDFMIECRRAEHYRTCGLYEDVLFPNVHPELSGPDLLVMDYEPNLERFDPSTMSDPGPVVKTALRAVFKMIFVDGLVHCDLHAGNIRYRNNGPVAFLDFGIATCLSPESKRLFKDFFLCVALGRGERAARIVLQTALRVPDNLEVAQFTREISRLVESNSGKHAEEFSVWEFVSALFSIQRNHKVYGSPEFFWPIFALHTFEGLVKKRCPDLDFQGIALEVVVGSQFQATELTGQ